MVDETETLAERMAQAGDSGYGDALSMQDLVGKVFQVVGFTPGESDGKFGTWRWNLVQVIIEEGEGSYETEAFLRGARVNRVLDLLHADGELPCRVRIIRRDDLQGNPWDLVPADAELPLDGDAPLVVEPEQKPKAPPLAERAKTATPKPTALKEVVTVRHKGGEQTDMPLSLIHI